MPPSASEPGRGGEARSNDRRPAKQRAAIGEQMTAVSDAGVLTAAKVMTT